MIDLHCHIIPFLDDGAENAKVACAMAEHALDCGVDTIVATPHCNLRGVRKNYRDRSYYQAFGMFRALLQQHDIPLTVLPGCELFAHRANLSLLLEKECLVTLNHSRYLLTEFNFASSGEEISLLLNTISRKGLIPVIAHPERYDAVQLEPALVRQWCRQGYIIQVNKGSLLGRLGDSAYRCGRELLRSGLVHVVASDAHDARYRPSGFHSLLPVLRKYCSEDYVRLLVEDNPRRILSDLSVPMQDY